MKQYCMIIRDFDEIREELEAVLRLMSTCRLIGDELLPM